MSDHILDGLSAQELVVNSLYSQAAKEGISLSSKEKEVLNGVSAFDNPDEEMDFENKICTLLQHMGEKDSEAYKAACKVVAEQDNHLAFMVQEYLETSTPPSSLRDAWHLLVTAVIVVLAVALLAGIVLAATHFVFGWPS